MVKKSYVVGVLGVVVFLFSFFYVYTFFVGLAEAESSNAVEEAILLRGPSQPDRGDNTSISTAESSALQLLRFLGGASNTGAPLGGASQGPGTKLVNPVGFASLGALIAAILDIIVQIAVPIAALFLIYSGFLFVTAQGDETKLGTAKSIFLWTMVGIAVLLGAKILAEVIEGTINQFKR
ncbi:MAG: pilin [bacterium]|nr:pilin [bacterium]